MEKLKFERLMGQAEVMRRLGGSDNYMGFERGLRRHYHGEAFGTQAEHELWLSLTEDDDPTRADRGRMAY